MTDKPAPDFNPVATAGLNLIQRAQIQVGDIPAVNAVQSFLQGIIQGNLVVTIAAPAAPSDVEIPKRRAAGHRGVKG